MHFCGIERVPYVKTLRFKIFVTFQLFKSTNASHVFISFACMKCANMAKKSLVSSKKQNNYAKVCVNDSLEKTRSNVIFCSAFKFNGVL